MPELFPHQREAVEWLQGKRRACLYDSRGLGKTAALIVAARTQSSSLCPHAGILVVCPTVVVWHWVREFEVWWPGLKVCVLDKRTSRIDPDADVVVTTHGLLISDGVQTQVLRREWWLTIVDELHFFRSPEAKRSWVLFGRPDVDGWSGRCVLDQSLTFWAATGTPMPNNPSELWLSMTRMFPRRFADAKTGATPGYYAWRRRFCKLKKVPFGDGFKIVGSQNVPELKRLMHGTFMRRTRDVLDLPPIVFEEMTLSPKAALPEELREVEKLLAPKLRAAEESVDWSTVDLREAFGFIKEHLSQSAYRRLTGEAKIEPVATLVNAELDADLDKIVVMAYHRDVVSGIADRIGRERTVTVTGDTATGARRDAVDRFQLDPACKVFIGNGAAGTGITLTAASELIMAELSYVPGDNLQAIDRIIRIGQTAAKIRIRFVSLRGTADASITAAVRMKMQMLRGIFAE